MRHLDAALDAIRAADQRDCAGISLFNTKGELFLVRRSEGQGRAGEWEGPGGHLQDDEDAAEGALREFQEEVGEPPKLKVLEHLSSTTPNGAQYTNVFAVTHDDAWKPTVNHEHDDWGWFPLDALPDPTNPGLLKALKSFAGEGHEIGVAKAAQESDAPPTGVPLEEFETLFGVTPEIGQIVELRGRYLQVESIVMSGESIVKLQEVAGTNRVLH